MHTLFDNFFGNNRNIYIQKNNNQILNAVPPVSANALHSSSIIAYCLRLAPTCMRKRIRV